MIDFWGTWCRYCIAGMPHLKSLHESYSKYGLEVIGIAYEQPAPAGEQMRLVQGTCDSLKIPYRVLLGSNMYSCPVKTQFGVVTFPSLFLLDENNRIIWKKDHALTMQRTETPNWIRSLGNTSSSSIAWLGSLSRPLPPPANDDCPAK